MTGTSHAETNQPTTQLDSFSYNDAIVRAFSFATLVWGLLATLIGLIVALLLVMPELAFSEHLAFGRLRPVHTNAAIFAFAGNGLFAAVYYSTQRLCKARMWSDWLSWGHFLGWQLIILAAAITIPLGMTQGKEYAEMEWPLDIALGVIWIFFFGFNFFMTLFRRRERYLYVSLWFYIASIVTFAILHIFNNLVVPLGWFNSIPIYAGVQDAMMQWWYGHNAIAFFLTIPFLGLMYYFLPKAAERPVYSYKLAILHFWALVFIYVWAGPHHLHYTSIAPWASTLGMVFSLMLWMPSWGGLMNGLMTLKGATSKLASEPALKFFLVALLYYGLATIEGPILGIKIVNTLTHYTDWTIAHAHGAALGWNGMLIFGMVYWLLPRIYKTELWSQRAASLHFWVATLGILTYVVPIYIAGFTQGMQWRALTTEGDLANPNFLKTLESVVPMWWIRIAGGALYVGGIFLMAANYLMTWRNRAADLTPTVVEAASLSRDFDGDPPSPKSRLEGKPVLNLAHSIDRFQQATWHRALERMPTKFTLWVLMLVVFASAFSLVPSFLIRSSVPTIDTVKPYTPLELLGRDLYVAEGCYNCHSQQIRPLFAETERYGDYSKPGEFVFDRPFQWGSRRIGPDLAREGGKQSHVWHFNHFLNPREVNAASVMPSYAHLVNRELNLKSLPARVQAAHDLGAPYERELTDAVAMAEQQARQIVIELVGQGGRYMVDDANGEPLKVERTQVIALIAYLQRLGTDIYATADQIETETPPRLTPEEEEAFTKFRAMLTKEALASADVSNGRAIYKRTCGACHQLFDDGGQVGPNLTGNPRHSLDYLLINIIAPSLVIPDSYRSELIMDLDGAMISGIILSEDDEKIILATKDEPRYELFVEDIEERKSSELSLMPAGQLDQLNPQEVVDLFKYLQAIEQVELPSSPTTDDQSSSDE